MTGLGSFMLPVGVVVGRAEHGHCLAACFSRLDLGFFFTVVSASSRLGHLWQFTGWWGLPSISFKVWHLWMTSGVWC
jgi:hypothetical protein